MFEYMKETPPIVLSVLLAVVTACIRVIYDKQETSISRVFLESVLCGTLAVIAGTGINALGISQDWTMFVGGMIGFIGSQSIRTYADMLLKKKIND